MTLPTSYSDGNTIHAADLNAWDTAINANTNILNGTTSGGATLTNPTVDGYTEGVQSLGTVTTSKTISALTSGAVATATLTNGDACAFTLPSIGAGQSLVLYVFQPSSTGSGTYSFTAHSGQTLLWPTAGAPTMTSGANKADVLVFSSPDGTNVFGNYAQGY